MLVGRESVYYPFLHCAACERDPKWASELLEKDADVDEKDTHGQTALHFAAWKGNKETMRVLLEGGASVLAENIYVGGERRRGGCTRLRWVDAIALDGILRE
jgi:hypothetical protein